MLLAKVVGNVISTQKQEIYVGYKLLMVKQIGLDGEMFGSEILAVDGVGAGIGDIVLIMQEGGSSRLIVKCPVSLAPIDVAIAGIVDRVDSSQGSFKQC